MNQDLEALIKAYVLLLESPDDQRSRNQQSFDRLLEASMARLPNASHDLIVRGIRKRAFAYLGAEKRIPGVPPKA